MKEKTLIFDRLVDQGFGKFEMILFEIPLFITGKSRGLFGCSLVGAQVLSREQGQPARFALFSVKHQNLVMKKVRTREVFTRHLALLLPYC